MTMKFIGSLTKEFVLLVIECYRIVFSLITFFNIVVVKLLQEGYGSHRT